MTSNVFCVFESADAAMSAAKRLGQLGFRHLEGYAPQALPAPARRPGHRRVRIPWGGVLGGLAGALIAYAVIWFFDSYDDPLDAGGQPLHWLPADIPIIVESTALLSGLVIVALFIVRWGLPRFYDRLFAIDGSERDPADRYWIGIDTTDVSVDVVRHVLTTLGATTIHGLGEASGSA